MEKIASVDDLTEQVGSIYKLCNLAAMRAMELNGGMKKLVDADPKEKVTTTAIREIAEEKVKLKPIKKNKKCCTKVICTVCLPYYEKTRSNH